MMTFLSGGAKNGKSMYAQRIAKEVASREDLPLYYVATMIPADEEDQARIARHVADRDGWGFITVEQPVQLATVLDRVSPQAVFLVDSVTALLSNEMFPRGGDVDLEAGERLRRELSQFCQRAAYGVFVSDYIYSDAMLYDPMTEAYRKELAACDRFLAQRCERVCEVACGILTDWKRGEVAV